MPCCRPFPSRDPALSRVDGVRRLRLDCRGVVQGVGFRPSVHHLARRLGLAGSATNEAGEVRLELEGPAPALRRFLRELPDALPPAARLEPLQPVWLDPLAQPEGARPAGLAIRAAAPVPLGIGLVAPGLAADRAPCPACLAELEDPGSRRHGYPFLSCASCGPRYSIATALPWCRAHTTLAAFPLCPACQAEFDDPTDRRFHAETIACPVCGPRLAWRQADGTDPDASVGAGGPPVDGEALIQRAVDLLAAGGILALQGVGGFQLLVDAANAAAVARLRARKHRTAKPFALLVHDPAQLADLLTPSAAELAALRDPAAPIVLLTCPEDQHRRRLAGVAPGAPGLGVMLPASPLHHRLARAFAGPLVATSGNRSGEPLCIDPEEALERLAGIADAFLIHDRPIARPLDDSVLRVIDGRPMLLRRARGLAPEPIGLPGARAEPPLLALGGDLKSAPALAIGDRLWLAPHLGDLADRRSQERWRQGVAELLARHGSDLGALVVDRHPEYVSRRLAPGLLAAARVTTPATPSDGGAAAVPLREVGHHLAHGLAVALEHGLLQTDAPLLVLALDGLGLGDGPVPLWGGELLRLQPASRGLHWMRLASLRPFPLPGGERAVREPRRSALGLLSAAALLHHPGAAALRAAFGPGEQALLEQAIAGGCNAPLCSSTGRLFDGVAALLGLVAAASHDAEAGLALEAAAARAPAAAGAYPLPDLDWRPLLVALLDDLQARRSSALCAARFHNGLAAGLARSVAAAARQAGPEATPAPAGQARPAVALAGGCFQNRLLLEGLIAALRLHGLRPFWSERLPANDGGLAAGQILAVLRG
ncbi:MAG: carbamoyltransferase HypF [Cyanobacteriota bacterium]|nr:carbamoyltransferase HypF [Cyanobacteriota bacterium]